jgi:hypothetical protein
MAWTLNSNRIYVQKLVEGTKQIIASLQPLAEGTVYQTFGYETSKVKVSALVVGQTILNNLMALTTTGLSYTLVSPEATLGDFFVSSVTADREKAVYQTIDTNQACETPVFNVDIELFKDLS